MRQRRLPVLGCVSVCALVVAACSGGTPPAPGSAGPQELDLGTGVVLVGEGDALLASPRDLSIDAEGRLYVLDRQDARVVVIGPEGELVRIIGGPGEGPGEFSSRLAFLGVSGSQLRVYDATRQTVQVLSLDGAYIDKYLADEAGSLYVTAGTFAADGTFAYGALPIIETTGLARLLPPTGGEATVVGELVAPADVSSRFIEEEIHQGIMPQYMRNGVLPLPAPDGGLWLFLQSESVLQRYARDGELIRTTDIHVPELDAIRSEFFEWYESWDEGVLRFFAYAADGFATDEGVWLLWFTPAGEPGLVTVHDDSGEIRWRLRFTLGTQPPGEADPDIPYVTRRYFAVDPQRLKLYVTNSDDSSLTAFDLPAEVLR